jgi:hypothetical protein
MTTATFSPCRTWRYMLDREIEPGNSKRLVVVMLNPSTADELRDDPTIRRVRGFAASWGYGSVRILNLFALRSPHPRDLRKHEDPVGPDNDLNLRDSLQSADGAVLAAWGRHGSLKGRGFQVQHMVDGVHWVCLGTNGDGSPKHPLYVPAWTQPTRFGGGA